jgi:hypothetical protein
MELTEIIKSTLSIFSVIAFVFIILSYSIYKIKDRSRIKPYLGNNVRNSIQEEMSGKKNVDLKANIEESFTKENQTSGLVLVKLPNQSRFNIINVNKSTVKLNTMEPIENSLK